jgi:TPR repeat protein
MGLDAREYGEGLDFLQVIREQKYATSEDVARREINFFRYLAFGFKCQKELPTDTLCMGLAKREADYLELYKNLVYLHSNKNRLRMAYSAINNNDVYLLYNLGDFYLKGSTYIVAHLDSSLYYFRKGGNLAFNKQRVHRFYPKAV